jgi:hypothetical protein
MQEITSVVNSAASPGATLGAEEPELPAVVALRKAVATFESPAKFLEALRKQSGKDVTSAHLSNWLKRDGGTTADWAMDIEAISGVPVEELRPKSSWHVVRGVVRGSRTSRKPSPPA